MWYIWNGQQLMFPLLVKRYAYHQWLLSTETRAAQSVFISKGSSKLSMESLVKEKKYWEPFWKADDFQCTSPSKEDFPKFSSEKLKTTSSPMPLFFCLIHKSERFIEIKTESWFCVHLLCREAGQMHSSLFVVVDERWQLSLMGPWDLLLIRLWLIARERKAGKVTRRRKRTIGKQWWRVKAWLIKSPQGWRSTRKCRAVEERDMGWNQNKTSLVFGIPGMQRGRRKTLGPWINTFYELSTEGPLSCVSTVEALELHINALVPAVAVQPWLPVTMENNEAVHLFLGALCLLPGASRLSPGAARLFQVHCSFVRLLLCNTPIRP